LSQKYLATWQGCLCVLLGAQASCSPRRHEDEESQKDFFASSCLRGEAFWLRLGCSVFIRRIREVPWPIAPFFRKKYVTVFSKRTTQYGRQKATMLEPVAMATYCLSSTV